MKNMTPFYIAFHVLKVLLFTISHQIFYFLLFYIKFYISRHHFSQIFRTSFNIIWKKSFCHKFLFFNGFTQNPLPPPYRSNFSKRNFFEFWQLSFGLSVRSTHEIEWSKKTQWNGRRILRSFWYWMTNGFFYLLTFNSIADIMTRYTLYIDI